MTGSLKLQAHALQSKSSHLNSPLHNPVTLPTPTHLFYIVTYYTVYKVKPLYDGQIQAELTGHYMEDSIRLSLYREDLINKSKHMNWCKEEGEN